ncbi:OLC1v1015708C1 [Oldenlandia corymbosa var. corymbosa]|uniref:OLC1v1015708C1 n=1 Tax=Oldenlandia corymbosa var. corymbosa TaxID=529605 RepID=A0AAV1E3T8_OLDCO|nr:OLC1v1015708C1 [Oldenlandia corymbosa var. corymbosa]
MEGEEEKVDMMMQRNFDATEHWFRMGRMQQPKHDKLRSSSSSLSSNEYFEGVNQFDRSQVESLDTDEPPHCWDLPVVTLTSIALTLPKVDLEQKQQLIQSVTEALIYIRIIEDRLDTKRELINIRNAAAVIWIGVDLYFKWLDVDLLHAFQYHKITPSKEILDQLSDSAKHRFKHKTLQIKALGSAIPKAVATGELIKARLSEVNQTVTTLMTNGVSTIIITLAIISPQSSQNQNSCVQQKSPAYVAAAMTSKEQMIWRKVNVPVPKSSCFVADNTCTKLSRKMAQQRTTEMEACLMTAKEMPRELHEGEPFVRASTTTYDVGCSMEPQTPQLMGTIEGQQPRPPVCSKLWLQTQVLNRRTKLIFKKRGLARTGTKSKSGSQGSVVGSQELKTPPTNGLKKSGI